MSTETAVIPLSGGKTVTADIGINEGALGIVERGYTEETRCLHFRAHFYAGTGAGAALRIIDAYNDFCGDDVARVLEAFEENIDYIDVGREYSPALYVRTKDGNTAPLINALDGVAADECEDIGGGIVRAWWD